MRNLPSGTVTFLFTDIEGSTKLWEERPQAMQAAHARQEAILREAITKNEGYAYKMIGDAFQAAFSTAPQALQAALDAQRALDVEPWGATGPIRVRMALHTGLTEERGTDYVGPILNRVARLMSAGHGGQVLISLATEQLVREHLPQDESLRDLGEHRLKDLQRPERVFQLVAPGLRADFPPLSTLDNRPNNLPLQSTPFIGRAAEVAEVRSMLLRDDVHLLTLTGAGGTGKTRLALQVAAELLDEFKDGVFFVYLAPITDPALVISTIAQTLGVGEEGTQPLAQTLQEYLRDKIMLLVVDNFEQVLDAATLVSDLLRAAPHLKVLATSRATLRLSWERRYEVPLLSVPDPGQPPEPDTLSQYESVELFIARAEAARPGFVVDNSNAPVVAEICYRLEGLPLAIELAAAWVKTLPPKDILSRLGSRLKLLTRGPVDQPSRHQTLRNTIEWSYDLLTAEEQSLFRQVAVFVGGHTLEAAETVCGTIDDGSYRPSSIVHRPLEIDILDGLASLVEKSLMYQAEGVEGEARFSMLETVREYA